MESTKKTAGRPKKEPTKCVSLRCKVDTWDKIMSKYEGEINGMFNVWLEGLLIKK